MFMFSEISSFFHFLAALDCLFFPFDFVIENNRLSLEFVYTYTHYFRIKHLKTQNNTTACTNERHSAQKTRHICC